MKIYQSSVFINNQLHQRCEYCGRVLPFVVDGLGREKVRREHICYAKSAQQVQALDATSVALNDEFKALWGHI